LRVVGGSEVVHSWRQCKRAAVVSLYAPQSRLHRAPLCSQHGRLILSDAKPLCGVSR